MKPNQGVGQIRGHTVCPIRYKIQMNCDGARLAGLADVGLLGLAGLGWAGLGGLAG